VDYPPLVFPFVTPQDLGVYSFCIDEDDRNPPGDPCVNCEFSIHAEKAGTGIVEEIPIVAIGTPFVYVIRVFNGFSVAGVATIVDRLPQFVETMGEPSVRGAEGECTIDTSVNVNGTISTVECEEITFPPNQPAEIRIPVMLSRSLFTNGFCPPSLSNRATISLGIESFDTEVIITPVLCSFPAPRTPAGERCFEQNCVDGFACATRNLEECTNPDGCGDENFTQIPTCLGEDREDITLIDE
jgi:hypothetical protein